MIATGAVVGAASLLGRVVLGVIAIGVVLLVVALLLLSQLSVFINRKRAEGFSNDLIKDIGRKFDSGLDTFKSNDKSLYSLPWYVMVGEPGAGKTEAIRHSNIGFPNGLNKPAQGQGGTVNMDWWFAKKAVLLDTAGRLMFEATEEWRSFLKMLKQHRPDSPINGMILAIPAVSLLTDNSDQIAEKAGQISQQFDAVQRELGVRFPVFVLVTKADMIAGFREFFFNLNDPSSQNQMLGWSNPAELDEPFQPELVDQHLKLVGQRLERRKLAMLLEPRQVEERSNRRIDQVDAMYAFPTELTRISSRLKMYLDTIFMPSEWSLKPLFLRGIYFTSAMSEGSAIDLDLAEAFGISPTEMPAELRIFGREKSYFLKDFFLDKCFPEGGLVTRANNVAKEMSRRNLLITAAASIAGIALILSTLYGQMQLRQSVSKPHDFWIAAANAQQRDGDKVDADRWFSIVTPNGNYNGKKSLPNELGGTVNNLFDELNVQEVITVPWIFKPVDTVSSGLDKLHAQAQRNLFEHGVLRPVITAAKTRLADDGAKLDPSSPDVMDATGTLLRLLAYENTAAADRPKDANDLIALDPLFQLLLTDVSVLPASLKALPQPATLALYKSAALATGKSAR